MLVPQGRNERAEEILRCIVESYISTGEPVASRTISKRTGRSLSPASVRNIMADLDEEGYLEQPHASAGRVPTARAFQSYVHWLISRRAQTGDVSRVRGEFSLLDTMEARLERSSHLLSTITRHVGIAAAIPTSSQTLDHIELVHLEAQRVLMVVVTRDHIVRNKVVLLSEPVTQDELNSIRNYVNVNFGDWALPAIQTELRRRLEAESATYDAILRLLSMLFRKGLLDIGSAPEVRLEGTFNLLGPDLSVHGERLRELFHALEEKKKILDLLEQFLGQTQGEIAFQVGLAGAHPCMKGLALIGVTCMLPGLQARMAVLGPLRMNYEKAITAVRHVGEALQSAQT